MERRQRDDDEIAIRVVVPSRFHDHRDLIAVG